jgi:hypothetical protein
LDFFIIPGDNEWNECDDYNTSPFVNDALKTLWRQYFASGSFENFDRSSLPSGPSPGVARQSGNSQNFFFYYHNIAFFGITEPQNDSEYDSVNASWISSNLSGRVLDAIVIFGHVSPSNDVQNALNAYKDVSSLYVTGNEHGYCMKFYDLNNFPKFLELTVPAFASSPQLVSVVKDGRGEMFFHIESTGTARDC